MKESVRLYRPHDIDLMVMYLSDEYKLGAELKKCLVAYANGRLYVPPAFELSEADGACFMDKKNPKYIRTRYTLPIALNPYNEEEAAAIEILKQVRSGYRCSFIKMLFRNNSKNLPLLSCIKDNGIVTSKVAAAVTQIKEEETTKIEGKEELSEITSYESLPVSDEPMDDTDDPFSFLNNFMTGI